MTPRVVTPGDPLTTRERAVLALVAQGCTNAVIGRRVGFSEDSVKHTVMGAMRKLGAADRTSAAIIGIQLGLIDPPARDGAV